MKTCQGCNGKGFFPLEANMLCGKCRGSGQVPSHVKLLVAKTVIVPMQGRLGMKKTLYPGDIGQIKPTSPKADYLYAEFGQHGLRLQPDEVELI